MSEGEQKLYVAYSTKMIPIQIICNKMHTAVTKSTLFSLVTQRPAKQIWQRNALLAGLAKDTIPRQQPAPLNIKEQCILHQEWKLK